MSGGQQTATSVRLWLERLWHRKGAREEFWTAVMRANEPSTSGHNRAIFAQAVIDLAAHDADLIPLGDAVVAEGAARGSAHQALSFICNQASADPRRIKVAPWLVLCATMSSTSDPEAVTHCSILMTAVVRAGVFGEENGKRTAQVARDLLAAAWRSADAAASRAAFVAALGAFNLAPREGAEQFMKAVSDETLPDREHAVWVLCLQADDILKSHEDAAFILVAAILELVGADVGTASRRSDAGRTTWLVRAYAESHGDAGPVPPREVSRWEAAADHLDDPKVLSAFLESAPVLAAQSVVRVLRAFEIDAEREGVIVVRGRHVQVLRRANWPVSSFGFEATLRQTLCDAISKQSSSNPAVAGEMIDGMADLGAPIETWQALTRTAAYNLSLVDLLSDFYSNDESVRLLSSALAATVRSHGESFPTSLRRELERTLSRLSGDGLDALARRMIEPALRGEAGDEDAGAIDAGVYGETAENDAMESAGDGNPVAMVDREALRFHGMSDSEIDAAPNVAVQQRDLAAGASAREIGRDFQGRLPAAGEPALTRAREALRELHEIVVDPRVHSAQQRVSWGTIARLASALALHGDDGVLPILLEASARPRPTTYGGDSRDLLNRFREEAFVLCMDGLVALAARGVPAAVDAVSRAVGDTEPAVRYQVADRVHDLAGLSNDAGWTIVEKLVRDSHPMVVSATTTSFGPFYERDRTRAIALDWAVIEAKHGEDAYMGQVNSLAHLAWYQLRLDDSHAAGFLTRALDMVAELAGPLGQLVHRYRPWLVLGGEQPDGPSLTESEVMNRTWALYEAISKTAIRVLRADGSLAPNINARMRSERPPSSQLLDDVAHQIYFASGAFDNKPNLTPAARTRFWRDSSSLMTTLGESEVIEAAGRVMDTLEHLLSFPADVPWDSVFALFLRIARSATTHGYARDWSGIDLIDRVLRRAASEHPLSFKQADTVALMSSILDSFLDAGWPKAYLLARDLDLSDSQHSLVR